MGSESSNDGFPSQVKLLVAGGFGVGKTTFVKSISEIPPLTTEETLTAASVGTDNLTGVEGKTTTTVALDFGRITMSTTKNLILYLFGTPGQERFWFMWDELCRGAIGAVVLADTRRLADCFGSVEFFERRGIRFVVAVNHFADSHVYSLGDVRDALQLNPAVPLVRCDARDRKLCTQVLITLLETVIAAHRNRPAIPGGRSGGSQQPPRPALTNGAPS